MIIHQDAFDPAAISKLAPENKTTFFRGRRNKDAPVEWIASLEESPPDPRVFASETDLLLPTEPNPNGRLFHNIHPIRYTAPMFYGRWRNMMLEMMFKNEEDLRFAIQPTGSGLKNAVAISGLSSSFSISFRP